VRPEMEPVELLAASERERVLYADLLAVYGELKAALAADGVRVDPMWLGAGHARAERIAAELRMLAGSLAPHRLTGAAVSAAVQDTWRASAGVAAAAAAANREVTALARARQAAIADRLGQAAAARRGLSGYRPPRPDRVALADRSA